MPDDTKKPLLKVEEVGNCHRENSSSTPLLSSGMFSAGIGTVSVQIGCRGIIGPVPPPLFIRERFIQLNQ